jgi:fucose permease
LNFFNNRLQAFFTIGGFLAPFLIQLFKSSDALKNCGGDTEEEDIPIASDNYWENMDLDIIPPYLIVGGFVAICGIFTMICAKKKLTEKLTRKVLKYFLNKLKWLSFISVKKKFLFE